MDKLMQAANSACVDTDSISSMLMNNIQNGSEVKGHIWWSWRGSPLEQHFDISDITVDKLMEKFADEFARVPFNCEKAWVGISAGDVCSMLPISHIDIFTCAEMERYMTDRKYLRTWIENKFAIPNYVKLEFNRGEYKYILQHKRLSSSQLATR